MKYRKHNRKEARKIQISTEVLFCGLMITGILTTILALLLTRGEIFNQIFFRDTLDTGMDFFHSIEYTRGRSPYALYNTLYPPLANLVFYILFRMVPSWQYIEWADSFSGGIAYRGTAADLRVMQPTLLIFLIFIMFISATFVLLVRQILSNKNKLADVAALCMLFSYGMLYAVERGNIIIISLLGTMIFVFFRNSENAVVREVSLIALAFAAGLKLYPAVFGILLLYDRQYKRVIRTVAYGIAFFVFPVFIFKEGIEGLHYFFAELFSFTSGAEGLSVNGFAFPNIIAAFASVLHLNPDAPIWGSVSKIGIVLIFFVLLCGFFSKKDWHKSLICCLAFILFADQGVYTLSFLLIPLLGILKTEEKIARDNVVPFMTLIITQMLLPILRKNGSDDVSIFYARFQLSISILYIYSIIVTIKNFTLVRISKKKEGLRRDKTNG